MSRFTHSKPHVKERVKDMMLIRALRIGSSKFAQCVEYVHTFEGPGRAAGSILFILYIYLYTIYPEF